MGVDNMLDNHCLAECIVPSLFLILEETAFQALVLPAPSLFLSNPIQVYKWFQRQLVSPLDEFIHFIRWESLCEFPSYPYFVFALNAVRVWILFRDILGGGTLWGGSHSFLFRYGGDYRSVTLVLRSRRSLVITVMGGRI